MSKTISNQHTRRKNDFPWEIAISSSNRPETLREKTLAVLKAYRIPSSKITIFVSDKEQKNIYRQVLKPGTQNKIVVGVEGVAGIHNFISDYYPIGSFIVNIADNIKGFLELDQKEKPLRSLIAVIKKGFQECERSNARLWGIQPVANQSVMKSIVSTELSQISGNFWGSINPGSKEITITLDDKEDYQRSILFQEADGAIIRFNMIAPVISQSKEPHFVQKQYTKHHAEKSARWLVKHYPDFVNLYLSNKTGYTEVHLKDMRSDSLKKDFSHE